MHSPVVELQESVPLESQVQAYTHKGGVSSNSWFIIINVPCSLLEGHHSCLAHNCHTSVLQHLLHTDIARLLHRTCRHLDNHNLINKRIALAQACPRPSQLLTYAFCSIDVMLYWAGITGSP